MGRQIVFIYSGYAMSGKTSIVNKAFEQRNVKALSASGKMHDTIGAFFNEFFYEGSPDFQDKNLVLKLGLETYKYKENDSENPKVTTYTSFDVSRRNFCITWADKVFRKALGTEPFIDSVLDDILFGDHEKYSVECIGTDEYHYINDRLPRNRYTVIPFNIRSENDLQGVDRRELIPNAPTFYNEPTLYLGEARTKFINWIEETCLITL